MRGTATWKYLIVTLFGVVSLRLIEIMLDPRDGERERQAKTFVGRLYLLSRLFFGRSR